MTLRAKPIVKGPGRSGWNSDNRRTFLTNLAFVVTIVASVLMLVGFAGYSWYDDHFGAAATVDGTTITKDQLRTRLAIEDLRIKYTESRIRTLVAAGRMSEAEAGSQLQFLDQRRQSLGGLALERLIDTALLAKLAIEEGIAVTEAEIDAQLLAEATTDEQRHVWVIEIALTNNETTGIPGDAERAAAKAAAEGALAKLKAGTAWAIVAKSDSGAASAAQDGDLGWLPEDSGYDVPFMTAVFDAQPNTPTDVIEGEDGFYRIGRVTEIAAASVDQTFQSRLDEADVKMADYREVVRGDLIRNGLDAKLVAALSEPSMQRRVQQIFLPESAPMPAGRKVRHILVSPKDDPGGAAALEADDPAWKVAEDEARDIYKQLQADPTKFDALARQNSDEGQAVSTGGKLPYYEPTSPIDAAFADAIFAPNLQPGQILAPFKSAFGWHVVQFMRPYGDGETAWLETIRAEVLDGADFGQVARDQGEGPESSSDGDLGWIARGQLDVAKEAPIFSAEVGGLTAVVSIQGEGVYLWEILVEELLEPGKEQLATFRESAFSNWYSVKKAAATITREAGIPTSSQ